MMPSALPDAWRTRADDLARFGAVQAAETHRALAAELEDALIEEAGEELNPSRAATESGYSERRLRELVADGTIENAGRKGAPRIRRGDLPKRAKRNGSGYDATADADALLNRMQDRRVNLNGGSNAA